MASLLDRSLEYALSKARKESDFRLKLEQKSVINAVVCTRKDVLGVLPTGYGKSLIFHLLSYVFDFIEAGGPPVQNRAITLVISPLNALMHDQISKLDYLGAHILEGTKKSIELAQQLAYEGKLQIMFSHPEVILEKRTKLMLKTSAFQKNVRSIVVDEAHLVDDW